ncbi:type I pullulanase [Streptococcus cristatus]|uniref:type I pullulanase n=1 Tax=Streptococcus cristatus TaxID=45634 RepID=UPI0039C376F4
MVYRIFQAYLDDENSITIELEKSFDAYSIHFTLEDKHSSSPLTIKKIENQEHQIVYTLSVNDPIDLTESYTVYDQDRNHSILQYRHIVQNPIFDELFSYQERDLGASYSPQATDFKLWAPISEKVLLHLEDQVISLQRQDRGVWHTQVLGDLEGKTYYYIHKVNGKWVEVHDPYALSSDANSGNSYVIDRKKISRPIRRAASQVKPTEAVIYEMSVRDFSMQKEAGFSQPGKFASLSESPTVHGHTFGLKYLQNLGITHVQLMPVYDFGSVDEKHPELVYNWGYDPVQYNVPEGSFSSDPHDPYSRIFELQDAIAAYHKANMSVIMDVVYNHVYEADAYAFEKIVPGYFYRLDERGLRTNGTFCGNDVASEKAMVRHYIQQSVQQWVSLYGFDGFRFDLMGILDITTMKQIAQELKAIHPNIYLYGEGWQMPTGLDSDLLAHQFNAEQLPEYGFFSDHFRDTIKQTIVQGSRLDKEHATSWLENVLTANVGLTGEPHFLAPHQAINYVECHDNATVFDYFDIQNPNISLRQRLANSRLALHIVLLSQGVPFLHSGQEFYRTKNLIDNTYNLPDDINKLDWLRSLHYTEDIEFLKQLIAFRKAHPLLTLTTSSAIQKACQVKWLSPSLLEYKIQKDKQALTILINFGTEAATYENKTKQSIHLQYPHINAKKPIAPLADSYTVPAKQVLVLK